MPELQASRFERAQKRQNVNVLQENWNSEQLPIFQEVFPTVIVVHDSIPKTFDLGTKVKSVEQAMWP